MYTLKWKNKLSGEEGFVKNIRIFRGYFENTFEKPLAHTFSSKHECRTALKILSQFGEMKQNNFEIVSV